MNRWLRWMPGVQRLAKYHREWLTSDTVAGFSLAALIVPAGMAYAELAGLPPISGLYASLAALVAYTVFGPSRSLVLGPDSATAPLVAAAIIPLSVGDPGKRLALAAMMALLVGVIAATVGVFRLGFITDVLSGPVRVGYMNGIALVVIVSQLPKFFGFSITAVEFVARVEGFVLGIGKTNFVSLALGVSTLLVIVAVRRFFPKFSGLLAGVVFATIATGALGLARFGVTVVGPMPQGLPVPKWPNVSLNDMGLLLAGAAGVAAITLADTTVLSRAFARRFGYNADADSEFIAMGAANLVAGLFQGFPVSGSQTRSAVAVAAGVKSQLAGLIAAVILAVALIAAPGLTANLPQSALAAVVILAALALADVRGLSRLWRWRRPEFYLAIAAFLGVVIIGVLGGVLIAIVLALLNFVRQQWRPHDAVLGRVPGLKGYHDIGDFPQALQVPGLLIFRFDAPLFFANGETFRQRVLDLVEEAGRPISRVLIAAEPITDVDTTAQDSLCDLIRDLRAKDIDLAFAELKQPVRARLEAYGVLSEVGEDMLFPTIGSAVHSYVRESGVEWVDPEGKGPDEGPQETESG